VKPTWLTRLPLKWRSRILRLSFNRHPAYRGTGGRVVHVAPDLSRIRVSLPLTWRTRNPAGSLYGGSLFAITDGVHPILLVNPLGKDVVIWDKAARIRDRRPGFTTLHADFVVDQAEIAVIRAALAESPKLDRTYLVELKDSQGVVYAQVERTVHVAKKSHYRRKAAQIAVATAASHINGS